MVRQDALTKGFPDGGVSDHASGYDQQVEPHEQGYRLPEAVGEAQAYQGGAGRGYSVVEPVPRLGPRQSGHRLSRPGRLPRRQGHEVLVRSYRMGRLTQAGSPVA